MTDTTITTTIITDVSTNTSEVDAVLNDLVLGTSWNYLGNSKICDPL